MSNLLCLQGTMLIQKGKLWLSIQQINQVPADCVALWEYKAAVHSSVLLRDLTVDGGINSS